MFVHPVRWMIRWLVFAVLAFAFVVWAVGFVADRDALWWWGPDTAHVMGRAYQRTGTISHAKAMADSVDGLRVVGHLPMGQPFLASKEVRVAGAGPVGSVPVPAVIYLHEWDGAYVSYSLEGGP